jgi:hypothetical protein
LDNNERLFIQASISCKIEAEEKKRKEIEKLRRK